MKYLFSLLIFCVFLLFSNEGACQSIIPEQGTIEHNETLRPCLTMVMGPEANEVEKEWESFMKSNYKVKFNGAGFLGMGNLLESKAIIIPSISSKTLDFYANIRKLEEGTELKVFVAFGYDVYINSKDTPVEFEALNDLLGKFVRSYLPPYYEGKVSSTEKSLKKLTKKSVKLEKKQVKYANKIERLEQGIIDADTALEKNKKDRELESTLLEQQKLQLSTILKQLSNL